MTTLSVSLDTKPGEEIDEARKLAERLVHEHASVLLYGDAWFTSARSAVDALVPSLTEWAAALRTAKAELSDSRDREAICCDCCDRYFPHEDMHAHTLPGDDKPGIYNCEDCYIGRITPAAISTVWACCRELSRNAHASDCPKEKLKAQITGLEERNEALQDDLDRVTGELQQRTAQLAEAARDFASARVKLEEVKGMMA